MDVISFQVRPQVDDSANETHAIYARIKRGERGVGGCPIIGRVDLSRCRINEIILYLLNFKTQFLNLLWISYWYGSWDLTIYFHWPHLKVLHNHLFDNTCEHLTTNTVWLDWKLDLISNVDWYKTLAYINLNSSG